MASEHHSHVLAPCGAFYRYSQDWIYEGLVSRLGFLTLVELETPILAGLAQSS